MRINLVAVGRRMPDWVDRGFSEYAKRLSKGVSLELIEVESPRRGNKSPFKKKVSDCFRRFRKAVIRLRLIKRVVVMTQRHWRAR